MKGSKRGIYIQPQLLANLLKMNNRQQREVIRDDELRSVSTAMKVVKEVICSQQQISISEDSEDIDNNDDINNEEFEHFMAMERENNGHIYNGDEELIQVEEIENTLQNLAGKRPSGDDGFEIENTLQNLAGKRPSGDDCFEIENTLQNLAGKGSIGDDGLGNKSECYANEDKEMIIVDNELIYQGKVKKTRGPVYCKKLTELAPGEKVFIEFNEDGIAVGDYSRTFSYFIGEQVRNRSVCPVQVSEWEDYTSETLDHLWRCIMKKKNGGKCSRVDMLLETRQRTSDKPVNSTNFACNMHAIDEVKRLKKERDEGLNQKTDDEIIAEVLGKDSHGYLRCYGRGRSITQYFGVKPSRLDLANEVMLVKRTTTDTLEEAKKELEAANKNAEEARKNAEAAKKEAEATRNEVDEKIAANNKIWEEKFAQLSKAHGIGSSRQG
ncbi:uncharacterized protein LOC141632936 isoform X4 [Silene latifolia]|uniref:uncharacterized protein LOC141632936 isoform X4 n=1 Tax=Silene latifolia TaxID=37657 RepID=UPI003D77010D